LAEIDIESFAVKDPHMFSPETPLAAHLDLIRTARGRRFGTILADPPWQFQNRRQEPAPDLIRGRARAQTAQPRSPS